MWGVWEGRFEGTSSFWLEPEGTPRGFPRCLAFQKLESFWNLALTVTYSMPPNPNTPNTALVF